MSDRRVAILDGSHSLFASSTPAMTAASTNENPDTMLGLRPIPQFEQIVTSIVQGAISSGELQPGKVAIIGVGVICDTSAVKSLGQALHNAVAGKKDI